LLESVVAKFVEHIISLIIKLPSDHLLMFSLTYEMYISRRERDVLEALHQLKIKSNYNI